MLKQLMLASALGMLATPAFADPDKDESGNGRAEWRDDRYQGNRYYEVRDRRAYRGGVPSGHLPPPGECRVWFPDRPAGQQPPPTSCNRAYRDARRYGGRVISGDRRGGRSGYGYADGYDQNGYADQRQFQYWALRNFDYDRDGRLGRREYNDAIVAWQNR